MNGVLGGLRVLELGQVLAGPFAGAILLLQGFVEIARCVICIRQGEWPSREQDVEEVDVDKLKAMVHADPHAELAAPPAEKGSPL